MNRNKLCAQALCMLMVAGLVAISLTATAWAESPKMNMTYQIARFMQDNGVAQMEQKGRIQVGADADITIFDPETVTDNSTMKDGGLPSTGIPYVVVNGTIVVKDSKVIKGVYPGKAIRRSVLQ